MLGLGYLMSMPRFAEELLRGLADPTFGITLADLERVEAEYGVPFIAVKVASGFYDNPALGLPTGSGMMALFDAATGMPAGLLFDNGFLTDIRTGAAGAVAAASVNDSSARSSRAVSVTSLRRRGSGMSVIGAPWPSGSGRRRARSRPG